VWGVAELEAKLEDPTYRGAISVAGDMSYESFEAHDAVTFDTITNLYWPLTAFGVKANKIPELARYNRDSRSTDKPIRGPFMVLAGDDDASVNFANIRAGVEEVCRNHLSVEFVHRAGLDHDPLMEKTIDLQLDWVRARLDGKPWSGNCKSAVY
jgi:hypothetical protein